MDNRIDAIYGRQSIDKKDSISIESQFEFCRYELKGGEAKEYKDKGYSGKNIERPDFQRLLQDIRLGLIKRVIVYKLDRISRSIVDFAKLMELFKQYDVEFVSCTEKFDTSTPMGRAMLNICIVFAQLERESIQMRVQDAFYSRCTKGYYMRGRTPYGFDTEPIVMDGIKTKKLVENAEMDFAELMFQMYAEPGNSYGDITRYFVKHSIKVYDNDLKLYLLQLFHRELYQLCISSLHGIFSGIITLSKSHSFSRISSLDSEIINTCSYSKSSCNAIIDPLPVQIIGVCKIVYLQLLTISSNHSLSYQFLLPYELIFVML